MLLGRANADQTQLRVYESTMCPWLYSEVWCYTSLEEQDYITVCPRLYSEKVWCYFIRGAGLHHSVSQTLQ